MPNTTNYKIQLDSKDAFKTLSNIDKQIEEVKKRLAK